MTLKKFVFNVLEKNKYSRCGLIETHRGNIKTPAFMPVGTQATVKAVFIDDLIKTGSEIILSNTYHLMIRPGVKRIELAGGLHEFMNCKLPILTDSGGFQVMSLSKLNKIDRERGAIFKSHIDGKNFVLSPEESIRIQKGLNSDILMVMDECPKKTNNFDLAIKGLKPPVFWKEKDLFKLHCMKWPINETISNFNLLVDAELSCKNDYYLTNIICERALIKIAVKGKKHFS